MNRILSCTCPLCCVHYMASQKLSYSSHQQQARAICEVCQSSSEIQVLCVFDTISSRAHRAQVSITAAHTHHLSQGGGAQIYTQKNKTRRQHKMIASSSQHLRLNYCGPQRAPGNRTRESALERFYVNILHCFSQHRALKKFWLLGRRSLLGARAQVIEC